MQKKPNKINSKEQKAVAGNWGKPGCEDHNIRTSDQTKEVAKHTGSKKYKAKKERKPWRSCPFCGEELPEVVSKEDAKVFCKVTILNGRKFYSYRSGRGLFGGIVAKKCRSCGSRTVHECPCCKHETFFNKETKNYKHQSSISACGFNGKKLDR